MIEPTRLHLTWEYFDSTLDRDIPGNYTIPGNPTVNLFRDLSGTRFGIRIPIDQEQKSEPTGLTSVQSEIVVLNNERHLQISTAQEPLFRQFLAIAQDIADQIQLSGMNPIEAVQKSLSDFRKILREELRLTKEQQIGIWGELWVLEQLISKLGTTLAIRSWIGPFRDPHDFRLNNEELEVKTTTAGRRVHKINRLDQLDASKGSSLHLVSIQIVQSGANLDLTLPGYVERIRSMITDDAGSKEMFELSLGHYQYLDEDSDYYDTPFRLRSAPKAITVGADFPKINRAHLDAILHQNSYRIDEVSYSLNVEGIDSFSGSPLLSSIFIPESD